MIAAILTVALVLQGAAHIFLSQRSERRHAEERRFLTNHALARTPAEFVVLQSAARPDDTVEAVAEARGPKSERPLPLGL